MRTFLGFLMLLKVSGDTRVNVTGFLNESVLLPCDCGDRTSDEEPKWQKINETMNKSASYAGRIELFPTDWNNCSVLLKNITEDDHGTYKCIYDQEIYQHNYVHLTVCGPFRPTQDPVIDSSGLRTFTCKVKDCNNETKLQWILDKNPLNSIEYNISSNHIEADGLFHFTNTLTVKVTESDEISSKLECTVYSPDRQQKRKDEFPTNSSNISLTIFIVVLILGAGLLLGWYKWKKKKQKSTSCGKK